MKKLIAVLCMITCLFSFAGCSSDSGSSEKLAPSTVGELLEGETPDMVTALTAMGDADLDNILASYGEDGDSPNPGMVAFVEAWNANKDDLGALVSIGETKTVVMENDVYEVQMDAAFELREAEIAVDFKLENSQYVVSGGRFDPVFTMGEKLEQAALNTLMGMGTVFVVLILISLIISCFKFVNKWEEGRRKAPEPAPTPVPVEAEPVEEEEDLSDDLELVAVITAAIAASEDTPADGLVVRSIRRAKTNKWKRA